MMTPTSADLELARSLRAVSENFAKPVVRTEAEWDEFYREPPLTEEQLERLYVSGKARGELIERIAAERAAYQPERLS